MLVLTPLTSPARGQRTRRSCAQPGSTGPGYWTIKREPGRLPADNGTAIALAWLWERSEVPKARSSGNTDHENNESTDCKVPMSNPMKLARRANQLRTVEARTLASRATRAGRLRLNLHVQRKELARTPETSEGSSESAESGLRHTMWSKLTIQTALIHYCNEHHV